MAVYVFRCPVDGYTVETSQRDPAPTHGPHVKGKVLYGPMVRDYRAEGASPAIAGLKRERELGSPNDLKGLFLPTAKDYAGPGDPDGQRGLRAWAEETRPAADNKRPVYPDMDRKVF